MRATKKLVQIVLLGHYGQLERARFLLRNFIPYKVYFLRNSKPLSSEEGENFIDEMEKELKKELPKWVADESTDIEVPFFKFEGMFPILLKIISEEKTKGNEVIVNSQGSSMPAAFAAVMAASLTGAKYYWAAPGRWVVKEIDGRKVAYPVGTKEAVEIKIPLTPELPKATDMYVLAHMLSRGGKIKGKLASITKEIGLENLGANVKKPGSGIVKLSKTIKRLREGDYITTRKIGRRSFEASLTDKGKMIAEAASLL